MAFGIKNVKAQYLEGFGLICIIVFCFFYSIFTSNFAERHINLKGLDFPVFIGEILLLFCGLLLALDVWIRGCRWNKWFTFLLVYAIWMLIKAGSGYYVYGPVAFRNAALFYYPVFFFFGYRFFDKNVFSQNVINTLLIFLAVMLAAKLMNGYYWFVYYIFFIVLIVKSRNKRVRFFCSVLAVLLLNIDILFGVSRSHLVGIVAAFLYISVFSINCFLNLELWKRLLIIFLLITGFALGMRVFADKNALKSMFGHERLMKRMEMSDKIINERKKDFKSEELEVNVYNQNRAKSRINLNYRKMQIKDIEKKIKSIKKFIFEGDDIESESEINEPVKQYRSLEKAYSNILFRLYIWRDMIDEMKMRDAFWGVSFGKPQRSESIEMLNWAKGEWHRDGWITPHNSFLHMFYRGGIVGLFLILSICLIFYKLTILFFHNRSIIGCLLIGILLYWVAIANFLVILEFPYHAIPFWSLFGVTFGYSRSLELQKKKQYDNEK